MLHHFPPSIDARIRGAIAEKHLIEVRYHGQVRVVEPHDYGVQNGVDRLLVYQLNVSLGSSRHTTGWRLFDIAKIESLAVLDAKFKGSRREAHQGHHTWATLYARVD